MEKDSQGEREKGGGGKRNAWKMDRKTEKRGKADLEKERERKMEKKRQT